MLRASDRRLAYELLTRVPDMHQPGLRWAILGHADLPDDLLHTLKYQGSVAEFVADLVRRCAEWDVFLLARVLVAASEFVGVDQKTEMQALADRLGTASDPPERTLADFLEELALHTGDGGPYLALDRLFVPPVQYPKIRGVLDEHHAVIILGDPHVGKTYSAVRLLWELYRDAGRMPRWISSNRLSQALQSPDGAFQLQVERLLGKGTAVYLEDPFGTTVPVDMRDFVNNLKTFFRYVRTADVRVVITSRSYVFNQVIPDLFATHVVTLSQELNLDVSYHQEDLVEIATRYMAEYAVAWRAEAHPHTVAAIVDELRAPHNIALFLIATRTSGTAAEALEELPSYRDVVEQFALMIKEVPLWLQGFLCVAYFFSDYELAGGLSRRLFDEALAAGDLGQADLASWERAAEELATYLTTRERWDRSFSTLRHPSIEDAFDQRVRADPVLREVVRRLLTRAAATYGLHLPAFRCFVHYSDLYWNTTWGQDLFHRMLAGGDAYLRETTRLYVIEESRRLPLHQRELLHGQAEEEWNDRFLLRLLIGAPVSDLRKTRLVDHLKTSWDDWIRYQLARAVPYILTPEAAPSVLASLLTDSSSTVARAAITSAVRLATRRPDAKEELERTRKLVPQKLHPFFEAEHKRLTVEALQASGPE